MPAFQTSLKSIFTICATVSEYTLILDRWIITAPSATKIELQRDPQCEVRRRRWLSAAKTSLLYALLEPAWCWFILAIPMNSPHNVIFCFLFGGFLHHLMSMQVATKLSLEALTKIMEEHERLCVAAATEGEVRASVDLLPNDEGEKESDQLLEKGTESSDVPSSTANPDSTTAPRPVVPCVKPHKLDQAWTWSKYLSTATAALTNAGTILYCRYLPLPDSDEWIAKNPIGWTVIALLALFILTFAKHGSHLMHYNTFRPHYPPCTLWDAGQVLSCLAIVLAVRAAFRTLLSQSPFTPVTWSVEQSAFVIEGYPMPRNATKNPDGSDIEPSKPWMYISLASSVCQLVGVAGYWGYRLYNRSRERRQARVD